MRRRSHRRHPLSTPTRSGSRDRKKSWSSTRRDAQIVTIGDRELPRILEKGLTKGVDYYSEFIDEGRFSQPDYQIAFRDFIASKYRGRQMELVIAMGEKPLEFVITNRAVLFAGTPIVYFADTDGPVPSFPNATGVVAKANLAGTVTLATALQPDTQNVFVVIGVGADAFLESARRQLRAFEPRLAITYLAGLPTADLEARLTKLPPRSIVYYLVVDRDGAGERRVADPRGQQVGGEREARDEIAPQPGRLIGGQPRTRGHDSSAARRGVRHDASRGARSRRRRRTWSCASDRGSDALTDATSCSSLAGNVTICASSANAQPMPEGRLHWPSEPARARRCPPIL